VRPRTEHNYGRNIKSVTVGGKERKCIQFSGFLQQVDVENGKYKMYINPTQSWQKNHCQSDSMNGISQPALQLKQHILYNRTAQCATSALLTPSTMRSFNTADTQHSVHLQHC
jgi:hypothetical protein